MKFLQAANYTACDLRWIDYVVVHDMEMPERGDTAEACARFFHNQKRGADGSSAHYCVDNNSIVQCVLDHDIAWHAPGANHNGIGIEHAGYAIQRAKDWSDPYSTAELLLSAELTAKLCEQYGVPTVKRSAAGIRANAPGIVGHWDVTKAFPDKGSHTDPGPNFPWARYMAYVSAYKHGQRPKV